VTAIAAAAAPKGRGVTIEEVTKTETDSGLEARSVSSKIRTVEDLLRHIEADMEKFEIAQSEGTTWEGLTADRDTGQPIVTQLHRVYVKLRPKKGPGVAEAVAAMIEGAKKDLRRPAAKRPVIRRKTGPLQLIDVADVHIGKYAWHEGTGHGDYSIEIAVKRLSDAAERLIEAGARHRPSEIIVAFMGDLFHCDNPSLMTTGGTPLAGSTDGRLQKMIEEGSNALLSVVDRAADVAKTKTIVVDGNHDTTLTFAYQRIMAERFRNDKRVECLVAYTSRQYTSFGRNLLGFAHGNKAKKKLPQLMALERPREWAACPYREWHTGHLHNQAAEWSRPIETIDGVLVRIAPSLSTPDDYHAVNGWVGQREAMESFIYSPDGGLEAMYVAGPAIGGIQ
jgi:hypothetical protein